MHSAGIRSAGRAGLTAGAPGGESPAQQKWHASSCKNASHGAVIEELLQQGSGVFSRSIVMNLDCDQVPLTDFWVDVIATADENRVVGAITCRKGGPMTGRVGTPAMDFVLVGGYDAEADIAGSGYQDVDILSRMYQRTNLMPTYITRGLGVYAPNSEDPLADRGSAKIWLCDQTRFGTWADMNAHNRQTMKKKAGYLRNLSEAVVRDWHDLSWIGKVEAWLAAVKSKWTWREISRRQVPGATATASRREHPPMAPGGAPPVMGATAKASMSPAPKSPPPSPLSSLPSPLTPPSSTPGTRSKATCPALKRPARPAAAEPKQPQPPPPPAFTQVQLKHVEVKAMPVLAPQRGPLVVLRPAVLRGSAGFAAHAESNLSRRDIRVNIVTAGWFNRASRFSPVQRGTAKVWRTS